MHLSPKPHFHKAAGGVNKYYLVIRAEQFNIKLNVVFNRSLFNAKDFFKQFLLKTHILTSDNGVFGIALLMFSCLLIPDIYMKLFLLCDQIGFEKI